MHDPTQPNELDDIFRKIQKLWNIEAEKFKIVADDTVGKMISSLPEEVLNMTADEFMASCDDKDFDTEYNKAFEVVDDFDLLGLNKNQTEVKPQVPAVVEEIMAPPTIETPVIEMATTGV